MFLEDSQPLIQKLLRIDVSAKKVLASIGFDRSIDEKDWNYVRLLSKIRRIRPRFLITNVDNSRVFMALSKTLSREGIICIAIQNGSRIFFGEERNNYPVNIRHWDPGLFYHKHFVALSTSERKELTKIKSVELDHVLAYGSFRNSYYYNNKEKIYDAFRRRHGDIPRYDVCLIANSRYDRLSNIKLIDYTKKLQLDSNLRICIALKDNYNSEKFKTDFAFFKKMFNGGETIFPSDDFASYVLLDNSSIGIGSFSTVLRESYSRGNVIYPLNFDCPEIDIPLNKLVQNMKPSYDSFRENLLSVVYHGFASHYKSNLPPANEICIAPDEVCFNKALNELLVRLANA